MRTAGLEIVAAALACAIVALPCAALAQTADAPYELARTDGPFQLDGVLDEPAWELIPPLPLVMYEPVFRGDMTEHTEIRVAYDSEFLYAGARMYDSDPDGIRANSMYRDRYSSDDAFSLVLDTFNDRETAVWFSTTPNGIRMDFSIISDLETFGDPFQSVINSSWNAFWDVATRRTDDGWFAEMRIPLSSLGFQMQDGVVEMGFSAFRRIARKNEMHVFPPTPPNWNLAFAKPSQLLRIHLRDVQAKKPVYITPYVAGGGSTVNELAGDESAYELIRDLQGDVGLDVKYNITDNLTLDVTINTDFAQAEADDEQVNLTRLSLFYPEKRQFFQERAGLFSYRLSGRFDNIFNTRVIGIHEGGIVPILGGTRLVGRIGAYDLGVLSMQTGSHEELPSENFGVYRVRKQVFNPNSYIGAIGTSRIGSDGSWNAVYGLDGVIKVAGKEYLEVKWAQVYDDEIERRVWGPHSFARLRLERRTQIGLSYILSSAWAGEDFSPGIGFISRTGYYQMFGLVGYGWFADDASPILSIQPTLLVSQFRRTADNSLDSGLSWFDLELATKKGSVHTIGIQRWSEELLEPASFPEDTEVPVGQYAYYEVMWDYISSDARLLRTEGSASVGSFYDGSNVEVTVEPIWNASRHIELGGMYQFNRVRFPDRDQGFYVHLARLRAQVGFTTRISLNAFIQYNTATDTFSANTRFRYNFREGNDLWLVYNMGRNSNRFRETPVLPPLQGQTALLKYTYTFIR